MELPDIIMQMLERLEKAKFHCAKCNIPMSKVVCDDHKCTRCGLNVGISASMQVESVFKGIEVPPILIEEMKQGLIKYLK